jgi:hypothetical protein
MCKVLILAASYGSSMIIIKFKYSKFIIKNVDGIK